MLNLLKSQTALGLEKTANLLKLGEVFLEKGKVKIQLLKSIALDEKESNVKPLYNGEAILATAVNGSDVLVRSLNLPLTKSKDIESALSFQAEPLLPYPAEEALLSWSKLGLTEGGTEINLFSIRKDLLQQHLDEWNELKIEPEKISCVQEALTHFGNYYTSSENPFFVLHLGDSQTTCILVKEGKLYATHTYQEGLETLLKAAESEGIDLNAFDPSLPSSIDQPLKRLQMNITRMIYALAKELKGESSQGFLLTGEGARFPSLGEFFSQKLTLPQLDPVSDIQSEFSITDLKRYALSIGLAIGALQKKETSDFRQQEFAYPHPWKRFKVPLASYFVLSVLLSLAFYFFGQNYLNYKEAKLKENYVELLAAMGKSYETFEKGFLAKNKEASDKTNGEVVEVIQLNGSDLLQRLEFLQKDLQAIPDSFPLFANIPRVSDVLAWLSTHPLVMNQEDESSEPQARLQIENFSYAMLKRPVQGKKQEKYQVKVEIEFSSPTPKWAREFHDALIASNAFVDPKGEVKWSSNRGRYRTSFYLKDKTLYPGQ